MQETITIPKIEYRRLKLLDFQFGKFLKYVHYAESVEEARKQVKKKQTMPLRDILREYQME